MNCKNCKASCVHKGEDYSGKCLVGYVPMTNAGKIRQMSDEDLAEWLWFKVGKCPPFDVCPKQSIPCEAKYCWLDWLKEEVEDGST